MWWLGRARRKLAQLLCLHEDVDPGTFICNVCGMDVEHTFDAEDI